MDYSAKFKFKKGQSLIEVLIALGVGTILLLGAVMAVAPAIKSSSDAGRGQTASALAKELLDGVRAMAAANWHNIDTLSIGSSNKYFFSMATSGFLGTWSSSSDVGVGIDTVLLDGSPTGTIGYWKLNDPASGNPIDFSGYRNKLLNSGGFPASVAAKYGNGFQFNGTAKYFYTSNSLPSAAPNYTLMAWIKTASSSVPILSNRGNGGSLYLGVDASGKGSVTDSACSVGTIFIFGSTLNNNAFHHLAYVRDSKNNLRTLYVDGVPVKSDFVLGCSSINTILDFGHDNLSGVHTYLNGILDEVRVFNRALSSMEINAIYSAYSFNRDFYVDNVYRDSNDNYVPMGSGTLDPSTIKVTVEYNWGQAQTKTFSGYLTRSIAKVLWQSDWSGGSAQNGPVTSTLGSGFATSTNIDYTTNPGSIRIKGL